MREWAKNKYREQFQLNDTPHAHISHIQTYLHTYVNMYLSCMYILYAAIHWDYRCGSAIFAHIIWTSLICGGKLTVCFVCKCVCLPHCALNGRDVWFTFLVCTKCKCDSYARFCLPALYLFMCPALCIADAARRDAAALVDICSIWLYHYFRLPMFSVCLTRFTCLLLPSQGRCRSPSPFRTPCLKG